jgi:hypothetical protein
VTLRIQNLPMPQLILVIHHYCCFWPNSFTSSIISCYFVNIFIAITISYRNTFQNTIKYSAQNDCEILWRRRAYIYFFFLLFVQSTSMNCMYTTATWWKCVFTNNKWINLLESIGWYKGVTQLLTVRLYTHKQMTFFFRDKTRVIIFACIIYWFYCLCGHFSILTLRI